MSIAKSYYYHYYYYYYHHHQCYHYYYYYYSTSLLLLSLLLLSNNLSDSECKVLKDTGFKLLPHHPRRWSMKVSCLTKDSTSVNQVETNRMLLGKKTFIFWKNWSDKSVLTMGMCLVRIGEQLALRNSRQSTPWRVTLQRDINKYCRKLLYIIL